MLLMYTLQKKKQLHTIVLKNFENVDVIIKSFKKYLMKRRSMTFIMNKLYLLYQRYQVF